ncbi:MAG TPA: alpha/beta hydrolase [Candidatus Binatia bacterium]|nr:alpha/beta hydrolase [Candidatus Binatia bacterium]
MLTSDYAATFDGALIHYQVNRKPKNPTLVLIHGVGSNHTAWSRITPYVGDRSYIAVDLRNHGLSGFGKFSLEAVTRDIAEVLVRERVREFIPVGMSVGAPVALELAKRFPKQAKGVVLISPSSRSLTRGSQWLVSLARAIRGVLSIVPKRRHLKLVTHERLVPAVLSPFWELKGIHLRDLARAIERALGVELDFSVEKPILVLTGRDDVLLRKPALTRVLREHRHVVHRELPTHHLILTRKPLLAAQLITAFAGD